MDVKMIYSALLLATGGLAVALSVYTTRGAHRLRLNRLFLLTAAALVIWALGLAVTGLAQAARVGAAGHRIALVGRSLIPALTLHFVMAVTGRDEWINKWWRCLLLYLPGTVTAFAGAVLPLLGMYSDALVQTAYGWANAAHTGWDWVSYAHTIVFLLVGSALLLRRGAKPCAQETKKQARILAYALAAGGLLSVLADVLLALTGTRFPQIAAVFFNIPMIATGYCIARYRFLQPQKADPNEWILSKATLAHVYRYFGLGVMLAGFAPFFVGRLLRGGDAPPFAWAVGISVVIGGVLIMLIDRWRIEDRLREMLVSACVVLLAPLILLWFSAAGVYTAWMFIFPLMILSLLFNRQIILTAMIASSVLSEILMWTSMPAAAMDNIGQGDYYIRLGVIVLIAFVTLYVNGIYTRRLRENVNHAAMQAIASEISHNFISISGEDIHEKLYCTLEQCGQFIRCDHAFIVLLNEEKNAVRFSVEWLEAGVFSPLPYFEESLRDIYPALMGRFNESSMVVMRDISLVPRLEGKLKQHLAARGIKGLVMVGIQNRGNIIGFIGFHANRPMREWNLNSTPFIQIAAGIVADAVIKLEDEQAMAHMAYHDQLTGLPNRLLFRERLSQAIARAEKSGKRVGVAFLDLDSFKAVNDTLGHGQGDRLLMKIARTLSDAVGCHDVVARFGGDEFILLFNEVSDQDALLGCMDRVMEAIQRPVTLAEQEFFVSASAGVALYPEDGETADALLKNADTAMYYAKDAGKSKYILCSKQMKDELEERIRLTNLLYRAQENGQLVLHFQPQVEVETQMIVGLEALIRWDLPGSGLIPPMKFIPLAEQTRLIHSIGAWVLEEACRVNRRFQEMGCEKLRISVNVSVHQLKNPNFVEMVNGILEKTGMQAQYLELEITESVANGNTDHMINVLYRLKELGVSISIDDFGTAYSSLGRLKMLPIDRIKMDMQFVRGIEKSRKDQAISKVIINLAKSLNVKVTAEGVETAPQFQFLKRRMCDEVQGYYYYKPLPEDEIREILKKRLLEGASLCLKGEGA